MVSELSSAAALTRKDVSYDWFPEEGGEFRIKTGAVIRYVEVKRPMYESERAQQELQSLMTLNLQLMQSFPEHATSFMLRPDLCDNFSDRQRAELDWGVITRTMIATARELLEANGVPGCREHAFGTVWLAHSQDELRSFGMPGISGLYLDNDFEADRIIKRVIKRAIQQLPSQEISLIYLDWSAATDEFFRAVQRRLSKLTNDDPQIAGVVVRKTMFIDDVVPAYSTRLIENPNLPEIAQNCLVTIALSADNVAPLRDSIVPATFSI